VRIISGKFRGKVIRAPKGLPVRPTTDFAKTGLFNILHNHFNFEEVGVLDLYCGTGNISYEFVSRGCNNITSVDAEGRCVKFVKETMHQLGARGSHAFKSDVFKFLANAPGKYDIIFADPPYESGDAALLPEEIHRHSLLNKNGWLVVEHLSKRKTDAKWIPADIRVYGSCAFSIYRDGEWLAAGDVPAS
jgi:16S rRNA (guanine966-N2)-methyltransferase